MADQPLTDDASATSGAPAAPAAGAAHSDAGASVATGAPPQQSASARRTAADEGAKTPGAAPDINPWAALSALLIGFFAGLAVWAGGRWVDHHRAGKVGVVMMLCGVAGGLLYAVGYPLINHFAGGGA